MQAIRRDNNVEVSASDGSFDYIIMNKYGEIKIDSLAEIKSDIAQIKSDLNDLKVIIEDCYDSINHALKIKDIAN